MLATVDYPPPVGGIQAVTKALEQGLRERGHDVCVVNFDGRNTSNARRLRPKDLFRSAATSDCAFPLRDVLNPLGAFRPNGYRDLVYHNLMYRVTNASRCRFGPDITHLLKPALYSAVYLCKEPFVVSCHGEEIQDTFGVRYTLSHASLVHCVSRYARSLVQRIPGGSSDRTRIIYNPLDLDAFRGAAEASHRDNLIICCCRLTRRKNVDSVIRAMTLFRRGTFSDYRLVIVGDGPEMGRLRVLTEELGLTEAVRFTGYIDDRAKVSWLSRAKLSLLCSKPLDGPYEGNEEGFGISLIEAQAAGVPVIGSNIGGIPEAVGDAGLLVHDPTDPQQIAEAMRAVLGNATLYDRLRHNALGRVQRFDRHTWISEWERSYARLLQTT